MSSGVKSSPFPIDYARGPYQSAARLWTVQDSLMVIMDQRITNREVIGSWLICVGSEYLQ